MDLQYFDILLEPTFLINKEQVVLYLNEAASLLVGQSPRRVVRQGKKISELINFEDHLWALENLNEIQGASGYQEVQVTLLDGRTARLQVAIQVFEELKGTYLVFTRDVTLEETLQAKYRRELQEKESYIQELEKAKIELDEYARLLEKKVEERTYELQKTYRNMKALLDSLQEGFFMFNAEGKVLDVVTRSCFDLLEKDPRGLTFSEVLGLQNQREKENVQRWLLAVFGEMLPFEDLAPLGPQRYRHSKGRIIELCYYPLRDEGNQLVAVIVVASDRTEVISAQNEARQQKGYVEMILKIARSPKQFAMFIDDSKRALREMNKEVEQIMQNPDLRAEIKRNLHTLKGGFAQFGLQALSDKCHHAEELFSTLNLKNWKEFEYLLANIQSDFDRELEELQKIQLFRERIFSPGLKTVSSCALYEFGVKHLNECQRRTFWNEFIFEPIEQVFSPLNALAHDMAARLGKQIYPLEIIGGNFKVWLEGYQDLWVQWVHLIRNAIDHGIESPEERKSLGKNPQGKLTIKVVPGNQFFQIYFSDDGRGISVDKIRDVWKSKGHHPKWITDEEWLNSIFEPGFSTRDEVTEFSGRGVGLDAIKNIVQRLGGVVTVSSRLGYGMEFCFQLPFLVPDAKHFPSSSVFISGKKSA